MNVPPIATPRPSLAVGYYVDNFEVVLRTVLDRYGDVLTPAEQGFAQSFSRLRSGEKRLYVRLASRQGPCFRRDRLLYREVGDLDAAITALGESGLMDDAHDATAAELLRLWRRDELLAICPEPAGLARSARRNEVVAHLMASIGEAELPARLRQSGAVVRTLGLELVRVYRLLFFGNLRQDWTEFVLRDLGVVRYEEYELGRELRRFPDRQSLDHDLTLRDHESVIEALLAAGELHAAVAAVAAVRDATWHTLARRRRDHIVARVARELERVGDLEGALSLYQATPVARERLARVLEKLGRRLAALAVCEEMGEAPGSETEIAFSERFTRRLLGDSPARKPRPPRPSRVVEIGDAAGLDLHQRPVEQRALVALAAQGEVGFFAENWLWRSLFGLLFWDVVFQAVPGAFHHPFQYGPSDLHGPEFRAARTDAIARRLTRVADDAAITTTLLEVYDRKRGVANPFVSWEDGARERIALAGERLGGRRLAAVADRIARDPGRYAFGFPDLFVCTTHSPGFVLYEVKGPGDVLRPEQGAWLDFMNGNGIPAVVLTARWR